MFRGTVSRTLFSVTSGSTHRTLLFSLLLANRPSFRTSSHTPTGVYHVNYFYLSFSRAVHRTIQLFLVFYGGFTLPTMNFRLLPTHLYVMGPSIPTGVLGSNVGVLLQDPMTVQGVITHPMFQHSRLLCHLQHGHQRTNGKEVKGGRMAHIFGYRVVPIRQGVVYQGA